MATSVTVDSSSPAVTVESIPTVDLRLLSQSELYSLSLCSPFAFNPSRDDDVIVPKIDRSVFNGSAGSRKQTYSRLRLAPATVPASSSAGIRSRTPHLRNPLQSPSFSNVDENSESAQIVTLLKQLYGSGTETNPTDLIPILSVPVPELGNAGSIGQKMKRCRPRKHENSGVSVSEVKADVEVKDIVVYQNVDDRDKEIVNKDGIQVDLAVLGVLQDPFGEELRRRTEGLGSADELLEFLGRLNGQWGSARKKRRIVDTGEFGARCQKTSEFKMVAKRKTLFFHSSSPAVVHGELQGLLNVGELSEVQVGDPLHCDKCDVTFNDKIDLLQHQLSSHQRRRSRNGGRSITNGVIIKDRKFECQFCHKTFEEKHRFNGYVGNHVKFQLKTADGSLPIKMGGCVEPNAAVSADHSDNPAPPSKIQEEDHMETDNKLEVVTFNINENNYCGTPCDSLIADTNKGCHNQKRSSMSCSSVSSNEKTGVDISKVFVCSNIEEPKQECLHCSNGVVDSCCVSVEDGKLFPTVDESKVEMPDKFHALKISQGRTLVSEWCILSETSKDNRDLKSSAGTPSFDKEGSRVDYVGVHSSCVGEHKPSSMMPSIENDCRSIVDSNDNKLIVEDSYSFVPHADEHVNTADKDVTDVSACIQEELAQRKGEGSSLLSPACDKNSEAESQIFKNLKTSADESKINKLQSITSSIVGFTSSNNHDVQKVDTSNMEKEKETSLAFCSPFPATNARASCAEDHNSKVYQSTIEFNDKQRSASALFSSTNVPEASTKEHTMNRSYNNSLNDSKFDGLENSGHHDLIVVFSNSHVDLGANLNCTTFQLGMEETYGVQDNLHTRLHTGKHGEVGIDLSDSTFKEKTGDFGSNFNSVFHSELKADEVDNSGKKIITGFGCGDAKPNEDVMAGSIWRTGVENVMQKVAQQSIQPQQRSHRIVFRLMMFCQISFMGTDSLNSLQEEPGVIPYNVDIEQGFNSSFWLGKDDLVPNLAGRNLVAMVCVWCRNEFYQEPNQLGAEAGSIGSMCPTCSGRISGQFSFM
ncbi:unnamed protein product [Withania somnifera]